MGLLEQTPYESSLYDGVLETYTDGQDHQTDPVETPPDDVHEFPGDHGVTVPPTALTPAGVMAGYHAMSSPRARDMGSQLFYDGESLSDIPSLLERGPAPTNPSQPAATRPDDPEVWNAETIVLPSGQSMHVVQFDVQRYQAIITCIAGSVIIAPRRGVQVPFSTTSYVGNGILLGANIAGGNSTTIRAKAEIYATEATGTASCQFTVLITRYNT